MDNYETEKDHINFLVDMYAKSANQKTLHWLLFDKDNNVDLERTDRLIHNLDTFCENKVNRKDLTFQYLHESGTTTGDIAILAKSLGKWKDELQDSNARLILSGLQSCLIGARNTCDTDLQQETLSWVKSFMKQNKKIDIDDD